jgi:diguanylate cyclase (GGDEF)-like protein
LLRALADQAATALAQVQRFQEIRLQARTDPLTGLANRRYFLAAADQALGTMLSTDRPLALILLDIDHFKEINDSHGHPVGDEVLRALCARLHKFLRSDDLLGRLGGEEFGVLLPDTPNTKAHEIALRLCQAVAASPFPTTVGPVSVTISLGVTSLIRGDLSCAELLSRSDKALYAAKAAGRNQVAVQEWGGVQLLSASDEVR